MASPFGSGTRPWRRITEALRSASSTVLGKGEVAVNDLGQIFVPDGSTTLADLSPLTSKADVAAAYTKKPVVLTQAAYDALATKDSTTLYLITD